MSLCLLNRFQMRQLYWPEAATVTRYSIPQHQDHNHRLSAVSKLVLRQTYRDSPIVQRRREQAKSIQPTASDDRRVRTTEQTYDGLSTLDETCLDQMVETDLVSSTQA